jgi:GT2 family glycosyltransferase
MPTDSLPDDVRRLLDERAAARADRDWDRADALRDRLADLGWEVQDTAAGPTAHPIVATAGDQATPNLLDDAAAVTISVQVAAEDHAEDLRRLLRGLAAHPPPTDWELVVVANEPSFDLEAVLDSTRLAATPSVLRSEGRLGWADARNLGLRASRGDVTLLLDGSIEPTGDVATPTLAAFDDPSVGLAGGWGLRSRDGRQFEEAPPGEVDAVEAYCMAIRREALRAVGGFDRRYRYYRNADLDLSFAVRDAGWKAVRVAPLPVVRHEHRGWSALPDTERDRLSKRNFYRFLDRWRDRADLLLDGEPSPDDGLRR